MKKHDMIHDMIYGLDMTYDMWHDTTYQILFITPQLTEAGWLYSPNNSVLWHYVMMYLYMWLQFVLRPIDFPNIFWYSEGDK